MNKTNSLPTIVALAFSMGLLASNEGRADAIALSLDFHIELKSFSDCLAKIERSKQLAAAVAPNTVNFENPEALCTKFIQTKPPVGADGALLPPAPFMQIHPTADRVQ